MALIVEYNLQCPALPLVSVSETVPDARLALQVGQPNHLGLPPFFMEASGGESETLEAALDASAFVEDWRRFDAVERTAYYQLQPAVGVREQLADVVSDPSRLESLAMNHSIIMDIRVTASGWVQKRWFADRDAFDEYRAFWQENDVDIAVHRLFRPGADPRRDALTDPQRDALTTAYEMGYFEIPRRVSLDAVADELGISPPSLSERLRRAHRHLVEAHLSSDDEITGHTY